MENGMAQTSYNTPAPQSPTAILSVTEFEGVAATEKPTSAQQYAARMQAHADHLTAHQRASGLRIRLCSSGCYAVYNAEGNFIARTAPLGTLTGLPTTALKTSAARMAYSEELATVCRAADIDFETSGSVSPATVAAIRKLLADLGEA
jgi:hypothetical protein